MREQRRREFKDALNAENVENVEVEHDSEPVGNVTIEQDGNTVTVDHQVLSNIVLKPHTAAELTGEENR